MYFNYILKGVIYLKFHLRRWKKVVLISRTAFGLHLCVLTRRGARMTTGRFETADTPYCSGDMSWAQSLQTIYPLSKAHVSHNNSPYTTSVIRQLLLHALQPSQISTHTLDMSRLFSFSLLCLLLYLLKHCSVIQSAPLSSADIMHPKRQPGCNPSSCLMPQKFLSHASCHTICSPSPSLFFLLLLS